MLSTHRFFNQSPSGQINYKGRQEAALPITLPTHHPLICENGFLLLTVTHVAMAFYMKYNRQKEFIQNTKTVFIIVGKEVCNHFDRLFTPTVRHLSHGFI